MAQQPEYCIIVNPAAHGGRAGRRWPVMAAALRGAGIPFQELHSAARGQESELAQSAWREGCRQFLAVGGDGTVNGVLNGLFSMGAEADDDFAVGVVPWGTGNDWARHHGIPGSVDAVVEMLQRPAWSRQDLGRVHYTGADGRALSRYFLNCAGAGFDSYLLQRMGSARGSRWRYLRYVLHCLFDYRAARLALDLADAGKFEAPALMLEICLGRFAGGGMQLAPGASCDDGRFEVLWIDELSPLRLLGSLHYLYNGRIQHHPAAHCWQARALSLDCRDAPPFHCDGELVGTLPVSIELLPGALQLIRPA